MGENEKFDMNKDNTNKFTNYSFSDYASKNVKCPSCGMFNPPKLEKCRRCGTPVPKNG
ncbi:MAG: Zn-finger in Ran binding protein [Firmicutes bacterium]|nr:Zn-finger in Ran binding protein [Bacillota bacterium]